MTSVEDYKSYTDIEHVRARPEMYIGSIKNITEERWVIENENDSVPTAERSEVSYNPGLEQCILEIITNATDHAARCQSMNLKPVSTIRVTVNDEQICVWNDGPGIPIKVHPDTITKDCPDGIYVPEMIFGNLRTSSNYDDSQKKTWGGKNGIGAKAANIYSTKFVIEVQCDGKNYKQTFTDGMTKRKNPIIKDRVSKDYVKINYFPDFKAFGMNDFSSNSTKHLIEKRCYDSSAATGRGVGIWFNKKKIPVKDFVDYMKLFIGSEKKVTYKTDRWEVGFAVCPYDEPTQISFVNGICTEEGGSHVTHVLDPVLTSITKALQDKNKGVTIRKQYIKDNVIIFIKALIDNPDFNSQLKRKLDSKVSDFGSRCSIPDEIIKKIAKLGITDNVLEIAKAKEMKKAMKTLDGTKKVSLHKIKKLADANWAGTSKSNRCTLILTEGDSAMGLALNGITAAGGRDCWGVFPLRGKFLNVRTATASQLIKNEEMLNINRILGLKEGLKDISKLRYHRVMIMSDQDVDGFHIKGLIMNYFTFNWPELVEQGLLECLMTPVIKVFKGTRMLKAFYNVDDYEKWISSHNEGRVRVKYYKGLGTSDKKEAKEYFKDLTNNRIYYQFKKKPHIKKMVLAFDKEHANDRKKWITKALKDPQEIDYNQKKVALDYFIDRELVLFSIYDNERSIPNIIDGLKPSQRKILYSCLKRRLFCKADGSGEIKVSQLSGYVSEHSAYHHGEVSLQSTITSMAQEFVGSGNLNLLFPSGNFGSRNQGGKDAASARYIFTYLRDYVKILFNENDNKLLDYLEDDGNQIEPKFYVPIIPLALLNGSTGIGTGWSTDLPCFNIDDIISNIRALLEDEDAEVKTMNPWYKDFKGTIEKKNTSAWVSKGIIKMITRNMVEVTEIPVGMWKLDFKEHLDKLVESEEVLAITSHEKEDSDDICFRIKLKKAITEKDLPRLTKLFKMEKNISGNNMVAFDENCIINKYGSSEDILWDFYKYRLNFYQKRKDFLEKELSETIEMISERVKFVRMVINDQIVVFKKPKAVIEEQLIERKFIRRTELMAMKLHQFTKEEIDKLERQLDDLTNELEILKSKSKKDLWKEDLDKLECALKERV